jgi:hypothetical protein
MFSREVIYLPTWPFWPTIYSKYTIPLGQPEPLALPGLSFPPFPPETPDPPDSPNSPVSPGSPEPPDHLTHQIYLTHSCGPLDPPSHLTHLPIWPTCPTDPPNHTAQTDHLLPWPNLTSLIYLTHLTHPCGSLVTQRTFLTLLTHFPLVPGDQPHPVKWTDPPDPPNPCDLPETLGPPYPWPNWTTDHPTVPFDPPGQSEVLTKHTRLKNPESAIEYGHLKLTLTQNNFFT